MLFRSVCHRSLPTRFSRPHAWRYRVVFTVCQCVVAATWWATPTALQAADAKSIDAARYRESILPLLTDHCFDCHGNGSAEGNLRLDAAGEDAPVDDR
ncbi:MAG: hypothetical protein KDA61_02195, partial [Planctomycetales bacterium]|nr:hypothetical protein [Planctomycetales bacterium]